MEEWSRKLKLLHWMMIERADGVSPLLCRDDDDDDDGAETFEGGANFDSSPPDAGSTQETFEGGANFDSSPGGTQDSGTQETFEGGANFDSSPGGGSVEGGPGGGSTGPENDFASFDTTPPAGYADYGSNVDQGLGASAPAGAAAATGQGTTGGFGTGQDFLSSSQPDPNVPDPTAGFNIAGLAPPGKEEQTAKETLPSGPNVPSGFGNFYDQPMGAPTTKELDDLMEKELQTPSPPPGKEQEQERELPANAQPTSFSAPYGSQQLDINAMVGPSQKEQSQWAPSSTTIGLTPEQVAQSNQWDIGPTTAVNAFGIGLTANPFASTNVWDPSQKEQKEEQQQKDPWDQQQTAFNTFGFNPTTPQGYNMPAAIAGTPTGAPPPDQQVATGPTQVQTTGFIAPNPTTPVTQGPPLGPAVPTGKSDFISSRDPFSNKDLWDPNVIGVPPVGMLMANVPTAPQSSLQEWPTPDKPGTPFGPQAPTQAAPPAVAQGPQAPQGQAPMPTGQQAFNPTPTSQQVPTNLFDLQQTQQQTPPSRASVIARSGQPEMQKEEFTREQLAILTDPRALQPYAPPPPPPVATAPPPSRTVDIPPHDVYEWPTSAPGREFQVDASGNLSFAPSAPPPSGPIETPPAVTTGGVPLGDLPGGGFPPSQAGGGSGVVQLPQQQQPQQQLAARQKRRELTTKEKRDAIAEALMRRDLNAPGVSDFDRLRLQP